MNVVIGAPEMTRRFPSPEGVRLSEVAEAVNEERESEGDENVPVR